MGVLEKKLLRLRAVAGGAGVPTAAFELEDWDQTLSQQYFFDCEISVCVLLFSLETLLND